jgi:FMN hydrolase / 5-amino-6-(5-phospho-D-ribitylamino)uracil phosphatase
MCMTGAARDAGGDKDRLNATSADLGAAGRREALLIDFGGTLDADGVPWAARFHAAYRRAGGSLSLRQFEPVFRSSDRALEQLPGIRRMGFRAMIDAQAELLRTLLPSGGGSGRAHGMAERFHAAALRAVDRNRAVLASLRQQYRLAVVSNFTGNLDRCLDELGIRSYFDVIADSAVHGVSKPDPTLFLRTLDALAIPAGAAWMIGDNPHADIRAAHALGMRTVWVAPRGRRAPPDVAATARVTRFRDVVDVLAATRPAGRELACTA